MTTAGAPMLEGCLLGTAIGDALGLPRENLSRRRALRLHGAAPLQMGLIAGRGYCSDDTEHSVINARAIIVSAGDEAQFTRSIARQLRAWFLTCPAGIGKATLKACLKLCLGFSPKRSGVCSAGNGPPMRAAIIGFSARSIDELVALCGISSRVTHTDPRAIQGAELVARTAFYLRESPNKTASELLEKAMAIELDPDLHGHMSAAIQGLQQGLTAAEFADSQQWQKGVSGFVNQTVPAALYCWAAHRGDFRQAVESAVLLGGDTDSVAAITGGIAGGELGAESIPGEWLAGLAEWPRNVAWMRQLSQQLAEVLRQDKAQRPLPMYWTLTLPRNLFFGATVIVLALRRLLPPY